MRPGETTPAPRTLSICWPWAAQYNTWLLIKLTPEGVVFSSLLFSSLLFSSLLFSSLLFSSLLFSSLLFSSLLFSGACNDCLLYHHKSKLSTFYAAGSLAWCAASAPSSLHIAAAERFALEQQAETGMCSMSQPEHGQQVCSGRSGHGACLVQYCGGPLPGTCHLSQLHYRD